MLNNQKGLSLVEILVALFISIFLLGGIIQVYLGNKTSYRFSDASARIQENGRFALDAITTDVRLAGFFGCLNVRDNPQLVQNHLNTASPNFNPLRHDFLGTPANPREPIRLTANAGLNNSDDLTIMGSQPGGVPLVARLGQPGSDPIQVAANGLFSNNDIVLITNCWTSDIFEASTVATAGGITTITHSTAASANSPGNMSINPCSGDHCLLETSTTEKPEKAYEANNSSAYILQTVNYSVQPSASGSGEPALWRDENNQNEELIEGVERMVVMYGIDTDNDGTPNQYRDSTAVLGAGDAVTALRVALVVRSDEDNILDANQTYTLNGVNVVAPDLRLRQVFSVTVDLRNR